MQKHSSPWPILLIYLVCALATLTLWRQAQVNIPTGDEPHYMVMANGLARHGALEQTIPYQDAKQPGQPERFGLPPTDDHSIAGPHGRFNLHNLGLPLLLALPFTLGGILGAKLFMILCGAGVVLCAWKISGLFSSEPGARRLAVLASCVAAPLVPAASQVYPDILGGLLALTGLYWFLTTQQRRSAAAELALAVAVVYLPWLQIKFGPACALLVLGVAAKIHRESGDRGRVARLLAAAAVSCVALAAYNLYAFGKMSGPYQDNAVEVSRTSLMVLMGLHFDQNQGFLLQNPINLLGLLGVGWLYRANRPFLLLWAAVFATLIGPNSLHPAWYGGWSFTGRFGWPAAVVFAVPTLYALLELSRRRRPLFLALAWLSVALQAYFFFCYAVEKVDMFNHAWETPLASYSMYYGRLHAWLPALYNGDWAFGYRPNYAWLAMTVLLLAAGFARGARWRWIGAAVLGAGVIVAAGMAPGQRASAIVLTAASLPGQTGHVDGAARTAQPGAELPGMLNFGPYLPLPSGTYRVTLRYRSAAPANELVSLFDVYDTAAGRSLLVRGLKGTEDAVQEVTLPFAMAPWQGGQRLEFRNNWTGKRPFTLYEIRITPG
ncbi:hypothetical protein RugamoR57_32370 [Duganella caerulea]|uniref:hypothetical protein n=1 Tax=Duganella caerulea TaxID=2885762 RepID=UPI0030E79025